MTHFAQLGCVSARSMEHMKCFVAAADGTCDWQGDKTNAALGGHSCDMMAGHIENMAKSEMNNPNPSCEEMKTTLESMPAQCKGASECVAMTEEDLCRARAGGDGRRSRPVRTRQPAWHGTSRASQGLGEHITEAAALQHIHQPLLAATKLVKRVQVAPQRAGKHNLLSRQTPPAGKHHGLSFLLVK